MRKTGLFFVAALSGCWSAEIGLLPEYVRPDPFGGVVAADAAARATPSPHLVLDAARGGYVSCHVVVAIPREQAGAYALEVSGPLPADLYREWFHRLRASQTYYPDALIPVRSPYRSRLPEPDNAIPHQTAQAFWLDIWTPPDAGVGERTITLSLTAGKELRRAAITVRVLGALTPVADVVTMDHNSYGSSWLTAQYPRLAARVGPRFYLSGEFFALIHSYHRLFYEHRGVFHQLGYGHGGKVGPEFAPRLAGTGKTKHIADWTLYDQHYSPLLDGSAMAGTRRGPAPIPFVYLPVNPEWPASYLWWGEAGYEREFVNVMSQMERHFREKGWTRTRFEMFFNHKKRYKAFEWDGDETRFPDDFPYFREYARLLKLAVPADSPVQIVYRADVSWQMERQFRELASAINFWVCGGGMFGWYARQAAELRRRGHIVWTYGGTPPVEAPASSITLEVLRPWILGIDGFVRWQTVQPGPDPWFQFEGGGETMVYPGDRFGIDGPLASIRLKLERNALQDLALLASFGTRRSPEALQAEAARRYNGTLPRDWSAPRPALAETDPLEWSNASIDEAIPRDERFEKLAPGAWQRVRDYALELAREVQP